MKNSIVTILLNLGFCAGLLAQGTIVVDSLQYERFESIISNFQLNDSLSTEQTLDRVNKYNYLITQGDSLFTVETERAMMCYRQASTLYPLSCATLNKIKPGSCGKPSDFNKHIETINSAMVEDFDFYMDCLEVFIEKYFWTVDYQPFVRSYLFNSFERVKVK